ncbi:MAG: class I SAM-dependent methyltransferase [Geobacter sp.]|nr:class I SAM-dependent methyltransferase [Geobacter sp.]
MQPIVSCPICGGTQRVHWGSVSEYSIERCVSCGIGITTPFPSDSEIGDSNADIYRVDQRGSLYLRKQSYYERRYHLQLRNIKRFVPGGRLLDIGCNIGLFLSCARTEGFDVEGIEFNKESAAFGSKHFDLLIHTRSLDEINYPDQTFDVITMYDVLEHIPDLHEILAAVSRILKPDGVLVVQSPNIDSLMARLTGSAWNWLTPPDHLYHFTPPTMQRLLSDQGFNVIECSTWEPAKEFSSNLIAAWHERGYIPKLLRSLLRDLRIVWVPIVIFQRYWWRRGQGGLVALIASNKSTERVVG